MKKAVFFGLLVMVLAFGAIGCDLGDGNAENGKGGSGNNGGSSITIRPQSDYYGTWNSSSHSFIIGADKVTEKSLSSTAINTIEHVYWEIIYNSNQNTNNVFPVGYKITGVVTENVRFATAGVGEMRTHHFYKHNILNGITIGIPNVSNSFILYIKQP